MNTQHHSCQEKRKNNRIFEKGEKSFPILATCFQ